MIDKTPTYTDEVLALMARKDELVPAAAIAPILKIHPSNIINHVKTGEWDPDRLGNYVISGDHVKFFRIDCLQKWGFIPKPKTRPVEDLLEELIEVVRVQNTMLIEIVAHIKSASAATLTDIPEIREKGTTI